MNTLKGLIGLIAFGFGGLTILCGIGAFLAFSTLTIFSALPLIGGIFSFITPLLNYILGLAVFGLILGFVMLYLGFKWIIKNQTPLVRFGMGIFGLLVATSGVSIAYLGFVPTAGWSLLIGGIPFLIGIIFMEVGFNLKFLTPLNRTFKFAAEAIP